MNDAWGPAANRGALAFVHIPPSVHTLFSTIISSLIKLIVSHAIQALQPGLNSTSDPGLNGAFPRSAPWLLID